MRGYKQYIVTVLMVILLTFSVSAEIAPLAGVKEGTGPDSMFWFADKFWENVQLSFTFNKEKKLQKYNEIMLERALEAQDMMLRAKFDAASDAEHEYEMTSVLLSNYFDEVKDDMTAEEYVRAEMFSAYVQALLANNVESNKAQIRTQLQEKVTEDKIVQLERELDRLAEESRSLSQELETLGEQVRSQRTKEFGTDRIKSLETSLSNRYNVVLVIPEPKEKVVALEGNKIAFENNKNCHVLPEMMQVGYDLSAYKSGDKYSYADLLSIIDMIVEQGKKVNDADKKSAYYDVAIAILDDVNHRYGGDLDYWLSHTDCPEKTTSTPVQKPVEKKDDDNSEAILEAERTKARDMLDDAEGKINDLEDIISEAEDDGKNTDDAKTYLTLAKARLTLADKAYSAEGYDDAYTYADQAYEKAVEGFDEDNFGLDTNALKDDIEELLQEFKDDVGNSWDSFESSKRAEYECDRDGDCDNNDEDDYDADWDDGNSLLDDALGAISGGDDKLEEMMILYAENLDNNDRDDYLNDLEDLYDEFKDEDSEFDIEVDRDDVTYFDIYDSDDNSIITDLETQQSDEEDGDNDEEKIDDWQAKIDAYDEIKVAFDDYYKMLNNVIDEIKDMD